MFDVLWEKQGENNLFIFFFPVDILMSIVILIKTTKKYI